MNWLLVIDALTPRSIAIMMFLVNLEVPVVITALVSITDDLKGFDNVGWIVAAYLLGYVGMLISP